VINYFARHPTAANLLMIVFILLGITALPKLQREMFPDIDTNELRISAGYSGASAQDVEDGICAPIEDALDGISAIEEVKCTASEGSGSVTAEMREGEDFSTFVDDVKTAVDAISTFPEDVDDRIYTEPGRTDQVASIAITGANALINLKDYALQVRSRLRYVENIAEIEVAGFSDRQIRIKLSQDKLRALGLTAQGIASTIKAQNKNQPAGTLETEQQDILLRYDDETLTVREFSDLKITTSNGGPEVRLGDIATIEDQFKTDTQGVFIDGQRAALLDIYKSKSQDILRALENINAFLEKERANAPEGIKLQIVRDGSIAVKDRISMLSINAIQGLALVFFSMWLFFGLKQSFWVTAGLPVAFMGTFFMMGVFGISINMITLVGLLIAVGLMMDDAIVISENIARHRFLGASPMDAAVKGTKQVLPGVVSSFLTTVLIFGSLAFIEGRMGMVLKWIPIVLIITIAVSLIEAFLILPHHLNHVNPAQQPGRFRRAFLRHFDRYRDVHFAKTIRFVLKRRYFMVGVLIAGVLMSMALLSAGILKFRGFPKIEGDTVVAQLSLPYGTPFHVTEGFAHQIEHAALAAAKSLPSQPGEKSLVDSVFINYGTDGGAHSVSVYVDLLTGENRTVSADDFLTAWRQHTPPVSGAVSFTFSEASEGPGGKAIKIRLIGYDLEHLKSASNTLQDTLLQYDGVYDVADDLRPGKPELKLSLKDGARKFGLTSSDVARQLRTVISGQDIREIRIGEETYNFYVTLEESDKNQLADLSKIMIATSSGDLIPLLSIADISYARKYASISRVNGKRTLSVEGNVDTTRANAAEVVMDVTRSFQQTLQQHYPDIEMVIRGAQYRSEKTGGSVVRNVGLGLIGVFLLLSFQFRSYLEPIVVMMAIPLSLIGAFWGHTLLGIDFSMPSMVGLASLFGVVVNDTILLVEFIKDKRSKGMDILQACEMACIDRLRPILLTSVTTIFGLTPLLLETSIQAQILIPLAISLAFGLTSATILSLFMVPALYTIMDDFGLTCRITKQKQEPATVPTAPQTTH
jgi:multidrug efflux pump subunit AcrB